MVFSSSIFIFFFLPFVLFLVFIGPRNEDKGVLWRNYFLTLGSFIFYAWGEPLWVLPLFFLAWFNYFLGKRIETVKNYEAHLEPSSQQLTRTSKAKKLLILGIISNIGLLFVVKYGIWLLNLLFHISIHPTIGITPNPLVLDAFPLPLGVSFFTFQATSYLIDIYRGDIKAASRYIDFSCYLTMFSQLVAGPIVRYADIADEITSRKDSSSLFYSGLKRFVVGLAKKVLIANQVALIADWSFSLPSDSLSFTYAWFGILAYAMQIYFDFSAYSDMAIGIGMMFGFRYLENFKHPYGALSMQDFWRKWHISLSSWLRDYLYIPLGGSRGSNLKTYRNLFIVFFICGLWHGAAFTFVLWGLWHGFFLALERGFLGLRMANWPKFIRHSYVWCIFLIGWVFFRSESIEQSKVYLQALINFSNNDILSLGQFAINHLYFTWLIVIAIILSMGKPTEVFLAFYANTQKSLPAKKVTLEVCLVLWGCLLCYLCTMFIVSGSYNPFIYFRF